MKKFTSLLLTAVLLTAMLSVFAIPASAEGEEVKKSENATWFENSKDPVWWELTENGTVLPDGKTGRTLTIGGKGEMPRYTVTPKSDDRPWKDYIETITTVVIDSGVTNIGNHAFNGCTNLTSVTIPSGVTQIGNFAFQNCKSLQSVTIPYGVTSIGGKAFYDCANLTSVTIPSGVTSIGSSAFQGCASLQSVTIPSSVTNIETCAFMNCKSLQSVTIPYGVTSIDGSAFQGCTSLQSVTIPSSVTRIDGNAIYSCGKLASVTVKTSTPPTLGSKVFDRNLRNLAIYVPCGAVENYNEVWSSYRDQIKEAYIVDDQPGENGKIMLDKDCFPVDNFTEEQTVTISVVPAEGYQLQADSLTVFYKDGEEEIPVELTQDETDPTKYSFEMPKANVTLKASFEAIPDGTGSILSGGSLWIVIAGAVVLVGAVVAVVVVKKKKM